MSSSSDPSSIAIGSLGPGLEEAGRGGPKDSIGCFIAVGIPSPVVKPLTRSGRVRVTLCAWTRVCRRVLPL